MVSISGYCWTFEPTKIGFANPLLNTLRAPLIVRCCCLSSLLTPIAIFALADNAKFSIVGIIIPSLNSFGFNLLFFCVQKIIQRKIGSEENSSKKGQET